MRIVDRCLAALFAWCFTWTTGAAFAQAPAPRTVRIVVPFPPGGSADVLARAIGQQIVAGGGPAIVAENKPGGGTVIATDLVARTAPDGSTVLLMANSFVINPSIRKSLHYDIFASFEPICMIAESPQILVVNSTSRFKSLADFVAAAKADPKAVNYATVGPATTQHIAVETWRRLAGIELTYVPYPGGGPAMTALLGDHVMAVLLNPSEMMEQATAGKIRALAVASRERFDKLPNVPTFAESGYPGFEAAARFGLMAPAKTPKDVITQHIAMFGTALGSPDLQSKLATQGFRPANKCGDAFGSHIRQQFESYAKVIRDSDIKAD